MNGRSSQTPVSGLAGWLRRLVSGRNGDTLRESVEELLEADDGSETEFSDAERSMLSNLLRFGELTVDDVMVPHADIVAVEEATTLTEVVEIMRKSGHSRLPVYRETLDDPIGMVHVRDFLDHWGLPEDRQAPSLASLVREVLFVPPSMPVVDLLIKMRTARTHLSLVVDEFGGIDGLATIEDLVEPIVGEIWDEHDAEDGVLLAEQPGGVIDAHARAPVSELEAMTGSTLQDESRDEDIDTVGGLVHTMAGRIPMRGEIIAHASGLEFEIVDADPRHIKRLRVRRASQRG